MFNEYLFWKILLFIKLYGEQSFFVNTATYKAIWRGLNSYFIFWSLAFVWRYKHLTSCLVGGFWRSFKYSPFVSPEDVRFTVRHGKPTGALSRWWRSLPAPSPTEEHFQKVFRGLDFKLCIISLLCLSLNLFLSTTWLSFQAWGSWIAFSSTSSLEIISSRCWTCITIQNIKLGLFVMQIHYVLGHIRTAVSITLSSLSHYYIVCCDGYWNR